MTSLKRLIIIGIILPLLSWLIFVYPWQRLFDYLPEAFTLSVTALIALWLLPVLSFYVWARTRSRHSAILGRISVNWLGISLMFTYAAALTECCRLLFSPTNNILAIMLIACGSVLSLYAVYCATKISTQSHLFESGKLNKAYKTVQLSDLHLGSRSLKFVARAVDITNEINPNLVFITGDMIDMSQVKPEDLKVLKRINAPTYLVTGNHDRYVGTPQHLSAIRRAGIEILDSRSVIHDELQIIGIADNNNPNQVRDKLADIHIDTSKYSILLYHKPENFSVAKEKNIDLMLSGHTHGGQIFPFNFIVKRQFPFIKGLYNDAHANLYVSQGTGTWGPTMRLGSVNEITVFELQPKPL